MHLATGQAFNDPVRHRPECLWVFRFPAFADYTTCEVVCNGQALATVEYMVDDLADVIPAVLKHRALCAEN